MVRGRGDSRSDRRTGVAVMADAGTWAIVGYACQMRLVVAMVVVLWGGRAVAAPAVELAVARDVLPGGEDCGDVECLIERAYRADPAAKRLALALWRNGSSVAGVGPDEIYALR